VKRVADLDGDAVVVHGDNADASTDSRTFGPVPRSSILGRAVYRYAPAGRAGRLR
jgi:signal peptidase I